MKFPLNQKYFHAKRTSIFKTAILHLQHLIRESLASTVAGNVEGVGGTKTLPSALEENRKLPAMKSRKVC